MAKKTKIDLGFDDKIDDFGFDNFDPFSPDPNPKSRSPLNQAMRGAKRGIKEAVVSRSTLEKLVRAAAPAGYVAAMDTAKDIAGAGKDLYNSTVNTIRPELESLKRNARRLAPKVQQKLPPALAKTIDKLLAPKETQSYTSNYDPDSDTIRDELANVFEATRMRDDYLRTEDAAREILNRKAEERRHTNSLEQLIGIRNELARQSAFQDSVGLKRDRKLLEIQYRQYFTQRDLLQTTKDTATQTLDQLKAVVHNTALPDVVKANTHEVSKRMLTERILGKAHQTIGNFTSTFRQQLTDRINRQTKMFGANLRGGLSGLNMAASGASMMGGMGGPGIHELGGEMAGGEAVGAAAGMIGKRLGRYLRRMPGVGSMNEKLLYLSENAPELLSEWARRPSTGINLKFWKRNDPFALNSGVGAGGINALKSLVPRFYGGSPEYTSSAQGNARVATSYDELSRKSLIEIIPGYLSKILHSIDRMRTGDPATPRTVFSIDRDSFETEKAAEKSVFKQVLPEYTRGMVRNNLDALVGRLDRGKKLSPAAREALRKQLMFNMINGKRFDPASLTKASGFDQVQDPDALQELTGYFGGMFPTDNNGNIAGDVRTQRRINRFSSQYRNTRDLMPNVDSTMRSFIDSGNRDLLRSMGALKRDGRREYLDPEFLIKALLTQEDNDEQTGEGPSGAPDRGPPGGRRRRYVRRGLRDAGRGPGRAPTRRRTSSRGPTSETDEVVDLYVDRETTPRLLGVLLDQGEYTDVNTGAVLRDFNDITGEVQNSQGWVILTDSCILRGIHDAEGNPFEKPRKVVEERIAGARGGQSSDVRSITDQLRDALQNPTEDPSVTDVYVVDEDEPRLTSWGFRAGQYFSATTGKVIRSLKDIRGPVVDASGAVLLTTGDILKGVLDGSGKRIAELSDSAKHWATNVNELKGMALDLVRSQMSNFKAGLGFGKKISDVYVLGSKEPVMTAKKMLAGQYRDQLSDKVIETLDDIKGAVIDSDNLVVVTAEDYAKGLWLADGTMLKRSGFMYQMGRFTRWYFGGYYKNLWKFTKWSSKKLGGLAGKIGGWATRRILGDPDVYVTGESTPRLQAKLLRRGMYLSAATGKRIFKASQIDGDVLGPDGETVLTADDIAQGLVDRNGKPIKSLGVRAISKILGLAGRGLRAYGNYLGGAATLGKNAVGGTAKLGYKLGRWALGGGFRDKPPGEERAGSWQERRRLKAEEAAKRKAEPKSKNEKEKSPLWGPILMLAGVVTTLGKKLLDKLNPLSYLKDLINVRRAGRLAGDVADLAGGGRRGGLLRRGGRLAVRAGAGIGRGALWAGRAALTGAALIPGAAAAGTAVAGAAGSALAWAGGALATLGAGALAVLTSPITLTALAVGAVGFGAWWLWKKYAANPDPIQQVRITSYGVSLGDRDTVAKVLKLEESVADFVKTKAGSSAVFTSQLPMKDIYALFEIDSNDEQAAEQFTDWLTRRFKPVFLAFASVGSNIAPEVKVHEQDDKIPDGEKPRLVRETRFTPDNEEYPYNVESGPIPGQPAVTGTQEIDKAIDAVNQKFGGAERKKRQADQAAAAKSVNAAIPLVNGKPAPLPTDSAARFSTDSSLNKVKEETMAAKGDVGKALWDAGSSRKIDELAGIRLRTYGLKELEQSMVNAILQMETDLLENVTYDTDGTAKLDYRAIELFQLYGPRFGVSPTDYKMRGVWLDWLEDRFMPTMLTFATAVRRCDRSIEPGKAWSLLKAKDQYTVAQAIVATTSRPFIRKVSVWTVTDSPFPGYELNTDSTSVQLALDSLKAKIKEESLTESHTSAQGAAGAASSKSPNFVTAAAGSGAAGAALSRTVNDALANSGVASIQNLPPLPGSEGNVSGDLGGRQGTFGDGTGGQYQTLPDSQGKGWEQNKDLITAAAQMAGVDVGTMATFAAIESDFNPRAKAGTSSASGLYQFINGTWKTMMDKYGAKYGIPPGTTQFDAKANALLGAEFLKENREGLASAIGREPTDVDLYLAHFFGLGGARTFLKMPDNAIAAQVMPKQAAANQNIFYNGSQPRTKAQVYQYLAALVARKGGKFAQAAMSAAAGGSGVATTDPVSQRMGTSETVDYPKEGDGTTAPTEGTEAQAGPPAPTGDSPSAPAPTDPAAAPAIPGLGSSYLPPQSSAPVEPEEQISPLAQQVMQTPQAAQRSLQQTTAQKRQSEVVTLDDVSTVLQDQLVVQKESRDLLARIATAVEGANSQPTNTSQRPGGDNTASTSGGIQNISGRTVRSPVSMRKSANG